MSFQNISQTKQAVMTTRKIMKKERELVYTQRQKVRINWDYFTKIYWDNIFSVKREENHNSHFRRIIKFTSELWEQKYHKKFNCKI